MLTSFLLTVLSPMEDIWDLELELLRLFIFKLTNFKDFWAIVGIVRLFSSLRLYWNTVWNTLKRLPSANTGLPTQTSLGLGLANNHYSNTKKLGTGKSSNEHTYEETWLWYHNDNQEQINSIIKMKLLEMDRVKAIWNKYAANKIIVTIMKSENIWLKWNSFDKLVELTEMSWEIIWKIQEKVLFSEREREFTRNLLWVC